MQEAINILHHPITELKISYIANGSQAARLKVIHPADAYTLLMQIWNNDTLDIQEEFIALYYNRGGYIIGAYKGFVGGLTSVTVDIRLLLGVALNTLAIGMLVAHNHPTGNLKPSKADEAFTENLKSAAALMDIRLYDHLIISRDGYHSMASSGML